MFDPNFNNLWHCKLQWLIQVDFIELEGKKLLNGLGLSFMNEFFNVLKPSFKKDKPLQLTASFFTYTFTVNFSSKKQKNKLQSLFHVTGQVYNCFLNSQIKWDNVSVTCTCMGRSRFLRCTEVQPHLKGCIGVPLQGISWKWNVP